jgi:isoamylase
LRSLVKQPFGASYYEGTWHFKVLSLAASAVDLVLFEQDDTRHPVQRLALSRVAPGIFHGEIREDLDGFLYGYQARRDGVTGNILLDPYAREIGQEYWENPSGGALPALGLLRFPSRFDWQGVEKPHIPYRDTLIYEAHVKGLTALHPEIPPEERGTFLGLGAEELIAHFKRLGVTAVELLPIFYHLDERFLLDAGLSNYWGYNPINFFALSPRLAAKNSNLSIRDQFRTAVRELHRAGIEVILDVVFNHSGEGSFVDGSSVSLRGLDESLYYRGSREHRIDYTGCGNTLNTDSPWVVQLICDSLRYWAEEMQVDGFRFDLLSAVCRSGLKFNRNHPLLIAIHQDPILSKLKLIAEPWDATAEGYQLGAYPSPWHEWNDRFRDTVRRFWRGDSGMTGRFVSAISGSSDVFHGEGTRSINFVTAHDGFTLHDLVTYSHKRNIENSQDGADGANENYSFNCGEEGESKSQEINELRIRQKKNLLFSLLMAKGVPMFLGGDEFSRTQRGNNNAFCHDTAWNYLNWEHDPLVSEVVELVRLRKGLSVVTDNQFYSSGDVSWLTPSGREFQSEDWETVPAFIAALSDRDKYIYICFNPTQLEVIFTLPEAPFELIFSTDPSMTEKMSISSDVQLLRHSVAVFQVGLRA